MAETTTIPPDARATPTSYDAFLSYSHADRAIAAGIQRGLHRIGRRMGRLHALRVFRDATDLTASPDLWGKVAEAMDRARYCIVVLSPASAASEWVDREIAYWLRTRGPEQLLFVVAGGQVKWDRHTHRFDPDRSTVALPVLTEPGVLPTEPLYVDVGDDAPWDPRATLFREKLTDLAAPIHGKPKYELAGEDLREQRRFRRIRRIAVVTLVLLTILALAAAYIAVDRQREAERQRNQAIGLRLVSDTESMLAGARPRDDVRAIQQTLAAQQISPSFDEGALLRTLNSEAAVDKIVQTGKPFSTNDLTDGLDHLAEAYRTATPDFGISFSPAGDRILTSGVELRLWDAATGARIDRVFEPRPRALQAVFSPDGRRIMGTDIEGKVRTWDAETGQSVASPLEGSIGPANSLALSPDGRSLVAGNQDGTIRWWDLTDGRTEVFTGHEGAVQSVAFSPDGRHFVSGGADTTVRIWNVTSPADPPEVLRRHSKQVQSVAWSPDGRRIASGSLGSVDIAAAAPEFGNGLLLWDADTREPVGQPLVGHDGLVNSLAFSPDSTKLASGATDGTIRLWNAATGTAEGAPLAGHSGWVMGVAFSPDNRHLASTAWDGTMRIWNVSRAGSLGSSWPDAGTAAPGYGAVLALEGDGSRFVKQVNEDAAVWVVDSRTGRGIRLVDFPDDFAARAAVSTDTGRVAVAGPDNSVTFYDAGTGEPVGRPLTGFGERVGDLGFSADGSRLATVTSGNVVQVWSTDTAALAGGPFQGLPEIDWITLSPDGRYLAAVDDKTARLWSVETGAAIGDPMTGHTADIGAIAIDPAGTRMVTHSADSVRLWDLSTGALVKEIRVKRSWAMAMAPDGSRFVTGEESTLRRWDVRTGEEIGLPMAGHKDWVRSLAISADSRYIVSGASDRTLRFWDLADGHALGEPLRGPTGWIEGVWISADGTSVLTRTQDYSDESALRTWPGPESWTDQLCAKLTFDMSRQQWADWVSPDLPYRPVCPDLQPHPDDR
ncbi:toll/interleukin-1 receptor domain-containing protein [Nocardia asteroides]|uniref:toll/interleukin-1 receptor domain-containing protein n=1 Tax=Nocardia asteroides TaxID=1824 RepID=UPI0037ACD826